MTLAVRWTIGDVSPAGWEAFRFSLAGALRLFGCAARYAVCVNGVSLGEARRRAGAELARQVEWVDHRDALPPSLRARFDAGMSEGVGWKLAPLRLFPGCHELALDNDVVLWELPPSVEAWLAQAGQAPVGRCLIAQDVERCLGLFDFACPPGAFNSGVRGVPAGYRFEDAVAALLAEADARASEAAPVVLRSELDEQGLQVAAVARWSEPLVVGRGEVSICSPFWPKRPELGRCGAHFVGLNARHLPWNYYDRPADSWMHEHWARCRAELQRRFGPTEAPHAGAESHASIPED